MNTKGFRLYQQCHLQKQNCQKVLGLTTVGVSVPGFAPSQVDHSMNELGLSPFRLIYGTIRYLAQISRPFRI